MAFESILEANERRFRALENSFLSSKTGTVVTNTTTETTTLSVVLPPGWAQAGDEIQVRALVLATATNATDTCNVKVKIGAVVVGESGALDIANNDIASSQSAVYVGTGGAASVFDIQGEAFWTTNGTLTRTTAVGTAGPNLTAAVTVAVTITWGVANAGNSAVGKKLFITRVPTTQV